MGRDYRTATCGWLKQPALIFAGLVLTEQAARADVGVPMIVLVWPASWLLLLLIVPIEAAVARRVLGVDQPKAWKMTGVANLVSSLAGIPITWFLLVILQLAAGGGTAPGIDTLQQKIYAVTVQSPWLIPYGGEDLQWMVPTATAVLCVPFFFMSVWIEYLTARRYFERDRRRDVLRWAWSANALSYGFLVGLLALDVMLNLPRR